jgi:predicted ATPase
MTSGSTDEVAQVCRHLDGLPVPIELAASQLHVLHLGELATRLSDRLRSADPVGSPRSGRSRCMVSWSCDLIPDLRQLGFARLGVWRPMPVTTSANRSRRAKRYLSEHDEAQYTDQPATAVIEDGLRCRVEHTEGAVVVTDMPASAGGEGRLPRQVACLSG